MLTEAAKSAFWNASSRLLPLAATQPRSPACGAVEASVETVLATSSQDLPPWMSFSAASALALASAFWVAVGAMAPKSTTGLTSMSQAWRVSGLVASSISFASTSAGVALTPSSVASLAWTRLSMIRSRAIAWSWFCCWVMAWPCAVACASDRCPARTAVLIRRFASSSRHCSIVIRSLSSSFEIDWPSTLPTDARWSL